MWHVLLQDCLYVFIKAKAALFNLRFLSVSLNNHQGDHIRLTITTNRLCARELIVCFHEFVSGWLQQHPSATKQIQFPLNHLFLDHPNNSIRYNLYNAEFADRAGDMAAHQLISEQLLAVLAASPIEEEEVLVFSLYIQLTLLRVYDRKNARAIVLSLIEKKKKQLQQKNEDISTIATDTKIAFDANREAFDRIFGEVFEKGKRPETLNWLKPWEDMAVACMKKGIFRSSFSNMTEIIYHHLGITALAQQLCSLCFLNYGLMQINRQNRVFSNKSPL
jgi:hypothetical protein